MFRETDENIAEVMSNKYIRNLIAHVMKSFDWEFLAPVRFVSHKYTANGGEIICWICVGNKMPERLKEEKREPEQKSK